jgi:hypothetical protein
MEPGTTARAFATVPERVLLASLSALALFLLCMLLLYPFGRDQGIFAVVGRTILEGGVPYKDAWDHKTPGIFFVNALAQLLAGNSMASIRIVETAALIALGGCFLRLSNELFGDLQAGIFGTVLAWYYYIQLDYWHTGQAEGFGAVVLAVGLLLVLRIRRNPLGSSWSFAGLGVLIACLFLLKPHLTAAFAAPLWLMVLPREQPLPEPTLSKLQWGVRVAWIGAAAGAVFVGVFVYFARADAWADCVYALGGYNAEHLRLSWSGDDGFEILPRAAAKLAGLVGPIGALGLAACVYYLRRDPDGRERRRYAIAIAGILLTLFLGVVLQGKLFVYHFASLMPFVGLLCGWGLWLFWKRGERSWPRTLVVLGLLAGLLASGGPGGAFVQRNLARIEMFFGPKDPIASASALYGPGEYDLGQVLRVSQWLQQNTRPNDAIYIWGFEPAIYQLSERRIGSRYLFNVPLRARWSAARFRTVLMQELEQDPPTAVIVMSGDAIPWVTGNQLDSRGELARFYALSELLQRQYEHAVDIGDFRIFLRQPGGVPAPPG